MSEKFKARIAEQPDWREVRRMFALDLAQAGWRQKDIATMLGVSTSAVSQWMNRARENGVTDLYRKVAPGAPTRLNGHQHALLEELMKKEPNDFDLEGNRWTRKNTAELILHFFGVTYSERHVGRILKKIDRENEQRGFDDT